MRWPTPPTGPDGAGITNTAPRPATTPATELGSHDQRSTTAVLAPVQLDEAAAAARPLPGGVGADGPVLDAAAHRRGSVQAPRVEYTPPGRDLLLHRVGWSV